MTASAEPRVSEPRARANRAVGAYVHFPWCLQKCPYCDFLSVPAERAAIPHAKYADAVELELEARAGGLEGRRLESIFFGGGTPSLWEPQELGRVLASVLRAFAAQPSEVEITVECNPSSLDADRARALADVGVNRLSVGVQSLDRQRLQFLGRLHDRDSALRALRAALSSGVRVSADLIFGVAGQSPADARAEVGCVADLGLTHLSAYALTIESGTRFGELQRAGRLPLLDEALVADTFAAVEELLTARGFEHYEISNYAKTEHQSLHNLGYWRGRDYLGLGTGAWGTWTVESSTGESVRQRYRNTPAPDRYVDGWRERRAPALWEKGELISEIEVISAEIAIRERLMLGLRLAEGVDVAMLERDTGARVWTPDRERRAERLAQHGSLVIEQSRLRIPRERWLWADGIIAQLM